MNINRKIDLSVVYWLKGLVNSSVTVVDGYPADAFGVPSTELVLPSVAVEQIISLRPYELGGKLQTRYGLMLDVYAKSQSQRDDIVYVITDFLASHNIPVYDYDMGFPPDASPTQLGALVPEEDIQVTNISMSSEDNQKLYWRSIVDFAGYYTT